ncbi:hypothetical protein MNEG_16408 [Monoraphidium neglectum]|uniref:Uncharacterized protein n=1 Tax=Monoraphidium neglectum TaxID=145388 RepID=A0A0D2LNI4_9CHLO|nr:hypothetical protein MNEG_16408 [Monoraphidium neglectum]KIY91556.1 hypothetical protein MNEG_16408 [Monoraphidium neglectum]|eukprot:XP_013890576.1 hypothetical protein MNEG_16408 [Monoraphidium neglectum]
MPTAGALSFDVVSQARPLEGAAPLADEALMALLQDRVGIEFEPPPEDGGSPSPLPASDFAAANSQIQALRRAAPGLVVSSAQARMIAAECFQFGPHRVEAAVVLFPLTVDRGDAYWTVAYALSGIEQSLLASRIGPAALFNPKRPSGHYLLDTAHPGHMEIARKLVAAAVASGELPNLWNLRLRGEWLVGC